MTVVHIILKIKQEQIENNINNSLFSCKLTAFLLRIPEITLMEANPLNLDQNMGTVYYNIEKIGEMGKWQTEVFIFNGVRQLALTHS